MAYEKDLDDPEIYVVGGIQHYITTNMGKYEIVWKTGEIECGIHGIAELDDVYRMIDSMYGGTA